MFRKMQFYQRMLLIVVAWSGLIAAPQAFAYKQITAGNMHTCGLKSDGSAICWGTGKTNIGNYPEYGQSIVPNGTFTQLGAGYWHTCGLKSDGSVTCWGYNNYGQTTVPGGTFTQLSTGGSHTCGLKNDGSATCWGYNAVGQSTAPIGTFTQLSAAGGYHTCGLKSDGSVTCWGYNEYGQTTVPGGTFIQISTGYWHTCGLKSDGSVICWGAGKTNTGINYEFGQSIVPSGTFTQISAGYWHTCGLKSDGSVTCWGAGKTNTGIDPEYGQSTVPIGTFTQISAGGVHTCGLKSNGSVTCWGAGKTNTGINEEYGQSVVPVDSGVTTGTPTVTTKLDGISTNAFITPANKMIAGVLVSGGTKRLMVRVSSVDGAVDPLLEIVTYPDRKPLGSNDSWATDPAAAELTQKKLAPARATDAAIIINLPPGLFTMEVSSKNGGSGAGIIEVYDMAVFPSVNTGVPLETTTTITKLDGISTNAFITPANKMIAGVLISGGTKRLMVRASSVDGAVDPQLEIVTYPDRKPLGSNDSWATDPAAAELTQKKLAPGRATDAAIIINLPPGLFTMEITSKNGGSGAGLIEVYDMAVFP